MKRLLPLLTIASVLIFGCGEPKIEIPPLFPPGAGTLTAKIDGSNFSASEPLIDTDFDDGTPYYSFTIGAFEGISGISDAIILAFFDEDYDALEAGHVFEGNVLPTESLALGGYTEGLGGANFSGDSEFTNDCIVTITAIDKDEELISGTFSFTASDTSTGAVFNVTEGVFLGLEY